MSGTLDLQLEEDRYRRGPSARSKLNFCIQQLEDADGFAGDLDWQSSLVEGLTVEEIAGTLLHARDELERYEDGER